MAGFGLQFQPGVPQNGQMNGNGQQRGRVQQPVQVLSTRLPKFFGAQSIAPASLLQGGGGMGQPGAQGNVVAQALAQLAGLPPGMAIGGSDGRMGLPPRMTGGGLPPPMPSGGGMFGPPGLQSGGPPPFMAPPSFNPPPPHVTPGVTPPGLPPPVIQPTPGPPGPPPQIIQDDPNWRDRPPGGNRFPGTIIRDDGETFPREGDDVIRLLAQSLFRR